jgi:hypothetical protein
MGFRAKTAVDSSPYLARGRLGGSNHYAPRSCQHHLALGDCAEHEGVRRLGWVRPPSSDCHDETEHLQRRTKKKDIYVISTPKRPVPLEHYIYAGRDTFKIVDSKGQFLTQG